MVLLASPQEPRHRARRKHRARSPLSKLIPLLLVIAGIAVLLYPVVGTYLSNRDQSGQATVYSEQIRTDFTEEEKVESLNRARDWNTRATGGPILDPWLNRIREDNPEYLDYLSQVALTDVMSRVIIPEITSDLPIFHGSTEAVLEKGVGHLYGSSLPVGGENTHAVLTGHTGLSQATLWDNLAKLEEGDAVYLETLGERMKYEIESIRVVLPEETDSLRVEPGRDLVTLITCTPYGVNSHRLVLQATRVPMDPEEGNQVFDTRYTPWQWWMTAVLVAVGIIIAVAVFFTLRGRRRNAPGEES